jgi:predicted patatin/cPLA2 family phospholipase
VSGIVDERLNGRGDDAPRAASGSSPAPEPGAGPVVHPVVAVLLERARSGSRPGARTDPHRVALVVEGGGMRGVVSGGMVAGLEVLGLRDAFDVVYGSSAGACAGAYFLAGQARAGARLYYQVANTRRFINPLRALQRRPIIDLDYLFGEILRRRLPLNFEALRDSGVELVVLASCLDGPGGDDGCDGGAVRFSDFADLDDLFGALHASSRLPVVGGPPLEYRGLRFWDAAMTQPIPVHAALADGCSHVLVLMTMPRDTHRRTMGLIDRLLVARRIATASPTLGALYRTRFERYAETCQLIFSQSARPDGPPYVAGIAAAASTPVIGRTEIRAARLVAAARAGGDAALATFGRGDARLDEQLLPVDARGAPIEVRGAPIEVRVRTESDRAATPPDRPGG